MTYSKLEQKPLRVAMIGPGKIGRIHARIIHDLGHKVSCVLSSTSTSAESSAAELALKYGHPIHAYADLDQLLQEEPLDGVYICSPPEFHFAQIFKVLQKQLPIFCEKPLFGLKEVSCPKTLKHYFNVLGQFKDQPIIVNTSNTVLMDCVRHVLPEPEAVKKFQFQFITQGTQEHLNIAADLLPHGISLLLHYLGDHDIKDYRFTVDRHSYDSHFTYGACAVHFSFRQKADLDKRFSFVVNEQEFLRTQSGSGNHYQVGMLEKRSQRHYVSEDPFIFFNQQFLANCSKTVFSSSNFRASMRNIQLMSKCLSLK